MQEYFSHDLFTRENLKVKKLISKHGMQGYGVFWALVEFLHNNNNKLLTDELGIISFDLGVDEKLVESVVNDFNLFIVRKKVISSQRVAQNIKIKNEKSKIARNNANKRWASVSVDATALPRQSKSNAIKERKEKESKENEKKENEMIEKEMIEKEITENESKKDEMIENKTESEDFKDKNSDNKENSALNTENNQDVSPCSEQLKLQKIVQTGSKQLIFNTYGSANNVYLTDDQYVSLCITHPKDVINTVIDELSYKIGTGKEKAFNAEFPDMHLVRLDRYARQKIATSGTAQGRANNGYLKNKTPSGGFTRENSVTRSDEQTRRINECEGVPPPPEFFEAGERLRKKLAQSKMGF